MQNQKNWFSISEAAKYLGVSPDTLRRWEKAKKIQAPTRTAGGTRRYSKELLDGILSGDKKEGDKKEKTKPTKKKVQSSTTKKQLIIGVIATIITLAILLPILLFLF